MAMDKVSKVVVLCENCGDSMVEFEEYRGRCLCLLCGDVERFIYNMEHPLKLKSITRVVNLHKEKCDVYIGRGSMWGNPYYIGGYLTGKGKKSTRKDVIKAYRFYFEEMIKTPEFHKKTLELQGKTLGCFCKPKACHGDILVAWLEEVCNKKM